MDIPGISRSRSLVFIAVQCGSRGLDVFYKAVSQSRFFARLIESQCPDVPICLSAFINSRVNVQKT